MTPLDLAAGALRRVVTYALVAWEIVHGCPTAPPASTPPTSRLRH